MRRFWISALRILKPQRVGEDSMNGAESIFGRGEAHIPKSPMTLENRAKQRYLRRKEDEEVGGAS
jgi:hypothetical protein